LNFTINKLEWAETASDFKLLSLITHARQIRHQKPRKDTSLSKKKASLGIQPAAYSQVPKVLEEVIKK